MSELYAGVVSRSDEAWARRTFGALASRLRLRLVRLAPGVFGVYRVAGRDDALDPPAVEQVARQVSADAGQAVALLYDNRCGVRVGVLYTAGRREREFGGDDAWWISYGEDGELVLDGHRLAALSESSPFPGEFVRREGGLGGFRVRLLAIRGAEPVARLRLAAEGGVAKLTATAAVSASAAVAARGLIAALAAEPNVLGRCRVEARARELGATATSTGTTGWACWGNITSTNNHGHCARDAGAGSHGFGGPSRAVIDRADGAADGSWCATEFLVRRPELEPGALADHPADRTIGWCHGPSAPNGRTRRRTRSIMLSPSAPTSPR
jgi:hypothetical protein